MVKILTVIGTRPEAIKMAPVIKQLEKTQGIHSLVCVTAQHRQMLDQVLEIFDIVPDFDLDLMSQGQTPAGLASKILSGLEPILQHTKPDLVLVHGDTATTFSATLSAFYANIPVAHIEAGLRTHNLHSPWPEEAHRQLTSRIASLHFAPSQHTAQNLRHQHISPDTIIVTGNTVIDALLMAKHKIDHDASLQSTLAQQFNFLTPERKYILITTHRRENFGDGLMSIIEAISQLANKYPDVDFVIPVHLNPNVNKPIHAHLKNTTNIHLIPPQEYLPFVWLMSNSIMILTDSGGIQEEAPSLNVPVLVMRDTTERQEALEAGVIKLVGTDTKPLVMAASSLLDDDTIRQTMIKSTNPYGDGHASELIVSSILKFLN